MDPSPVLTRLYDNIVREMAPENIRKHRHILDHEPDIGKLKIKEGSIIEYIPSYNNLFNKGKMKVFPLQRLEEIMVDPSKYVSQCFVFKILEKFVYISFKNRDICTV